jgi:hypothetical protein
LKLRALLLVALATLGLAGVAAAKTITLTGRFKGDSNSEVTLKVAVDDGVARKVRSLRISNLDYICPSANGEQSIDLGTYRVVKRKRAGRTVYKIAVPDRDRQVRGQEGVSHPVCFNGRTRERRWSER